MEKIELVEDNNSPKESQIVVHVAYSILYKETEESSRVALLINFWSEWLRALSWKLSVHY